MQLDELERLATQAIGNPRKSLFFRNDKPPVVQIKNAVKLPEDFPIANQYLGYHNGKYVYNLDAIAVIKYVQRYKAEFVVN